MIVHLTHNGPRAAPVISQGLLQLNRQFSVDTDYVSLGEVRKKASENLWPDLLNAELIISGSPVTAYRTFCDEHDLWPRVVWYDFEDFCRVDEDVLSKCRLYLKRTTTCGEKRLPLSPHPKIVPLDYAAMDEYYGHGVPYSARDINVAYMFPRDIADPRRRNVMQELLAAGFSASCIGETRDVGSEARRAIACPPENNCFIKYLRILGRSKVVFTAFPQRQDGDSRTWEAFASGALVFRDIGYIDQPKPPRDGVHCFFYDATDRASIRAAIEKARYYLAHTEESARIAQAGFELVRNYHRPMHRVRFILSMLQQKAIPLI